MGRIKSILAGFMSIVLMIGLIANINIVNARAEGEGTQQVTFTLSIGMNEGSQAPSNYGISYTVMEADGTTPAAGDNIQQKQGSVSGNSTVVNSQQFSITIPSNYKIKIEINSAGKDILINGADVTSEWSGGKVYDISEINNQTIAVLLRDNDNNNNNPGGNQGGGNQTARIEFQGAVKVDNQDAVTYTLGENTYTVGVALPSGAQWNISDNHLEIENIPEGQPMTFTLSGDALGNSQIAKPKLQIGNETMEFDANYQISKAFSATHFMINLVSGDNNNQGGGQNQGGQGNQGPANQANVNLTVSWTGSFGEIKVGGSNGIGVTLENNTQHFESVNITSDNQIEIILQAEYTMVFSSVKIKVDDGQEQELVQGTDYKEQYTFKIPKTTRTLSINAVEANSGDHTIVWTYDKNKFQDDAYVEHGQVTMVSSLDGSEGHYVAHKGDSVTVKLIPDYGYQVVGATLNGSVELTADGDNTSQFTFTMPDTNIHFKGVFKKTEDLIENNVRSVVSGTTFTGKDIASTGGTAKMTLGSATASDTSAVSKEIDTNKTIQAVDIKMEQLFYKNTSSDMWTTQKTDLASEATVTLTVTGDASVGYAVLREHNGTVEEIPANYDAGTNTITFKSAKYSTYTLVPLKETNNTLQDVKPEDTQNSNSKSEAATTVEIPSNEIVEAEEVARPVQTISIDKSQVSLEANKELSGKTYNLSSYITAKGFTTAIEKIVKSNPNEKRISIYTSKPICFTKTMLSNITKTKADVVYYFMHKGHLYSVTIPANTDVQKIFGKTSFQGPLYIGKVLGTSRLIK